MRIRSYTSNTDEKYTRGGSCANNFLPFYRNNKLQRLIKYQGPKTWTSLESFLQTCKPLKTFKFYENISYLKNILSKINFSNKFYYTFIK